MEKRPSVIARACAVKTSHRCKVELDFEIYLKFLYFKFGMSAATKLIQVGRSHLLAASYGIERVL